MSMNDERTIGDKTLTVRSAQDACSEAPGRAGHGAAELLARPHQGGRGREGEASRMPGRSAETGDACARRVAAPPAAPSGRASSRPPARLGPRRPAPARLPPLSRRRPQTGVVLRTLTDEEREARARALIDARVREEEDRRAPGGGGQAPAPSARRANAANARPPKRASARRKSASRARRNPSASPRKRRDAACRRDSRRAPQPPPRARSRRAPAPPSGRGRRRTDRLTRRGRASRSGADAGAGLARRRPDRPRLDRRPPDDHRRPDGRGQPPRRRDEQSRPPDGHHRHRRRRRGAHALGRLLPPPHPAPEGRAGGAEGEDVARSHPARDDHHPGTRQPHVGARRRRDQAADEAGRRCSRSPT